MANTYVSAHLNHLTLAGYRPRSIECRRDVLRTFSRTLPAGTPITSATRYDIEAFLARPIAAESRRAYRGHLRGYYLWLKEEGLRLDDPTDKLPPVRVPRGTPRPVEGDDLALALSGASPKMRAWLLLMALGGLRCIEVAALRPEDLILEPVPLLFLRECKGGGTATVPAHPAIVAALSALTVANGRWWDHSAHTISKAVGKWMRHQGVRATAHQLRHLAGTSWYTASGHDLLLTAQLLRHANVNTTMIYARLDASRSSEVVGLVPYPSAS